MGVSALVAIISSQSKSRMECHIKISLCNNLHVISHFLESSLHYILSPCKQTCFAIICEPQCNLIWDISLRIVYYTIFDRFVIYFIKIAKLGGQLSILIVKFINPSLIAIFVLRDNLHFNKLTFYRPTDPSLLRGCIISYNQFQTCTRLIFCHQHLQLFA